ncbi:AAA family ATPase [Thermodesulfobacteriota bacterium]
MYTSYFGFSENPFNLTPDPRYLFLSPHHKEAIDHLLYGINERKGFIVITGGIGTGKTTLCRELLNHLGTNTKSALIFNSFISDMELLKTINQEFGIDMAPNAETKKDYIDALNQFLLKTFGEGGKAILLIDEAQNLSHNVLEQIRMLSNLETTQEKLIQVVLAGQPELKEVLLSPSIRQLNERIMVRYHLKSLVFMDIRGYVEHRMVVAGGRGNLPFTGGALRQIYAYSGGNPRRINTVCDRALLIAYAREKRTISKGIVKTAVRELRGDLGEMPRTIGWSSKTYASHALLLILLIIVAGFGGWSYREGLLKIAPGKQVKEIIKVGRPQPEDLNPREEKSTLFLDEQTSFSRLFSLFHSKTSDDNQDLDGRHLSLVKFNMKPEYYIVLKKPFRVSLAGSTEPYNYLLIRYTQEDGAVAIDANGKDRKISRDFILRQWGQEVSWVYPPKTNGNILLKGMSVPDVLELQKTLIELGYLVEPTGIYDQLTFQETMKFQKYFGLDADGIAGPRTRALLYQMVK